MYTSTRAIESSHKMRYVRTVDEGQKVPRCLYTSTRAIDSNHKIRYVRTVDEGQKVPRCLYSSTRAKKSQKIAQGQKVKKMGGANYYAPRKFYVSST